MIPLFMQDMPTETYEEAKARHSLFRSLLTYDLIFIYAVMLALVLYVVSTPWVPKGKRVLWVAVLFLGNALAYPFFWYHYIWNVYGTRKNKPSAS